MKALIYLCPPYQVGTVPSLGLGYLKAVLNKLNHESKVFDANKQLLETNKQLFEKLNEGEKRFLSKEKFLVYTYNLKKVLSYLYPAFIEPDDLELLKEISADVRKRFDELMIEKPDVVCFSLIMSNVPYTALLAKKIKEKTNIKVIFGGPVCNYDNARIFLKLGLCDYVVTGEGEISFEKLINSLEGKIPINEVTNISYWNKKDIENKPETKLISKLQNIPLADLGQNVEDIMPIMASRGCTKKCNFCAETNQWKYYRTRNVDSVIAEMEKRIKENKTTFFFFCDSLINGSKEWLEEFCDKVTPLKIIWNGSFRCENLSFELLQKLKDSGCDDLEFGVENFNQEILDSMNKGTNKEEMMQILKDTHKIGMGSTMNIMFGYPGETQELFFKNLDYVFELMNEVKGFFLINSQFFRIFPGSKMMKDSKEFKIKLLGNNDTLPPQLAFIQKEYNDFFVEWKGSFNPTPIELFERTALMEDLLQITKIKRYFKKQEHKIDNYNFEEKITQLIKNVKQEGNQEELFLEFDLKEELLVERTGQKIHELINLLEEKNIPFSITKTLPPCIFGEEQKRINAKCQQCINPIIEVDEKIKLCTRKIKEKFQETKIIDSKYFDKNKIKIKSEACNFCTYRKKGECEYIYC